MWQNATLLECFCSWACLHRWSRALSPVTLFALPHQLHFVSSLLLLQLRTFPSLWYCNLPARISERGVLSKPFKMKKKKKPEENDIMLMCQIKLFLCCYSMILSPALQWQAASGYFIIIGRCSSAIEPQHWITWSDPTIQNQPITGIFLMPFL